MSIDVREAILARLLEVVAAVPNIRKAVRNDIDIVEDKLPAISVYDGDEETNGAEDPSGRLSTRPYVARMMPQIVVQELHTDSELSALRREIIRRVLNDAVLIEKVGGNGAIRYVGCDTDFGWARERFNTMSLQFVFQYSLKIEEL